MKILIVHNEYGKYSGEEAVVDKMKAMLEGYGHQVVKYHRSSVEINATIMGKLTAFFNGIYSPTGVKGLRSILEKEHPDVVNVHNLYPLISPAALFECKKAKVPVVMTVHNFRLICPTGLFMYNNMPCELCRERGHEWSCIRYNCEHSLVKSFGYTFRNVYARWTGAYRKCVTRFACITDFQRQKLIAAGFDPQRIVVIPNSTYYNGETNFSEGDYIAFCGRISNEKGVDLIIEAARRHTEIPFKLAGVIRDKELVQQLPSNIELLGYISGKDLQQFYLNARFIIMASRCYEGFPMSILEAAQYSKCTIGPNHGSFTEIIGKGDSAIGRLFSPGNAGDLEQQIVTLWNDKAETIRLGKAANKKLQTEYSTKVIYEKWERLFNSLIKK